MDVLKPSRKKPRRIGKLTDAQSAQINARNARRREQRARSRAEYEAAQKRELDRASDAMLLRETVRRGSTSTLLKTFVRMNMPGVHVVGLGALSEAEARMVLAAEIDRRIPVPSEDV